MDKNKNLAIKDILKNKIGNKKTLSKGGYSAIPFISIKTVDDYEDKKFIEVENFKSSIEREVKKFDSSFDNDIHTEKYNDYNNKNNHTIVRNKAINNIYRDAFKKENKRYSNDVGTALSNAIFSNTSSSSDIEDILETYEISTVINKSIDDTIPMTLEEILKKNKVRKSYTRLDNIYNSVSGKNSSIIDRDEYLVNEKKTESNNSTTSGEVKKLILDYNIEVNENTNKNNSDIKSILDSVDKNTYKEDDTYFEVDDSVQEENNKSIFEFEASKSANKPYKREDHFPPVKPKVEQVVESRKTVDYEIPVNNNTHRSVEKTIEETENNDYEDTTHYHRNNEYIETIKEYRHEDRLDNVIKRKSREEEIPTIAINSSKSKFRIGIVDSDEDIYYKHDKNYTNNYKDEEDNEDEENYNSVDLARFLEDVETEDRETIYTKNEKDIKDIREVKNIEDREETTEEETENNININNIDFAHELELERKREKEKELEREREKIKNIIAENIELPKPKQIKKIEKNVDDDFIQTNYDSKYIDKHYTKPPLDLLERVIHVDDSNALTAIKQTALQLENTLLDFGIEAKVTGVSRGPVVTRYELELASGTRVSKIVSLTDNIALALASESVRIIAPIPGRSVVGIEIPNRIRTPVSLREILETADFKASKKDIPFVLGKGIYGNNVITDLAEAPHLLVAGTTGSGKSVCLSTIILSLLFKLRPDELKFIFIDKKRVELSIYNGIPHLMSPVVSDEKKATVVLRHIVDIMERRYERMEKFFVRNVKAYNEKVHKLIKEGEKEFEGEPLELFPYIVVVIDELHNLMVVSSKEVEDLISRLAGMSRAVGIHLIIATQRPSADVVTGVIKANLPTRIAFQVPNKTNSRIIIDMAGAEQLLGKGDGLFCSSGSQMPERVQGAFVSDAEVKKVVDFLSQSIEPVYDEALISALDKNDNDSKDTDEEDILDEELWADAINVVARTRKASASFLQRRLKIGYNRAARIVEIMERQGLVGPENGSKPREVLIDADYQM